MNNVEDVISVLQKMKINVKVWRHVEPEVVVRALRKVSSFVRMTIV